MEDIDCHPTFVSLPHLSFSSSFANGLWCPRCQTILCPRLSAQCFPPPVTSRITFLQGTQQHFHSEFFLTSLGLLKAFCLCAPTQPTKKYLPYCLCDSASGKSKADRNRCWKDQTLIQKDINLRTVLHAEFRCP